MSESLVTGIITDAVETALKVAAPMLITAIVLGLIISILQATTQIQEQTLTFVPKLLGIAFVGILLAGWIKSTMTGFFERIFDLIAKITT